MAWYVLDTSLLLGGKEPPRDRSWATTPEADAEVSPGGRDARRYAYWKETGLEIRSADENAWRRVEDAAGRAGSLARLSPADRSLLALAHELGADLVTDDHTILDVATRLGVTTRTVNTSGIAATKDWRLRCAGCGRWYDEAPPRDECTVCGHLVRPKPWQDRGS